MFFNSTKKKSFSLIILSILLFMLTFVGCGKNEGEKPQPTPPEEKRICSFSISNLDSEFPLDKIDLNVDYGVNLSGDIENCKAAFLFSDNSGKTPTVLQSVENLDKDGYSFTVSEGNYTYKKQTILHLEGEFFGKTEGEFFLSLCLFSKDDDLYENPIAGYQYGINYVKNGEKITFEIKSATVVRHH